MAYVAHHWVTGGFAIMRKKGNSQIATAIEGGNVGGVMQTVHYDEKRLSVVARDEIRRGSVGVVSIKGVTGGINRGRDE